MFVNLNVHSYYSLLMSSVSIDDIISFALKNQQKYVCLVDINVMYGAMEFYQKAVMNHLQPIIGIQITYKNHKMVILAKNLAGYQQLCQISSWVMLKKEFEINDYLNSNVAIICDQIDNLAIRNYNFDQQANNPIAMQEVFFPQPEDYSSYKALKAIKNECLLEKYDSLEENNECFFLNQTQASEKFNVLSLKNLEIFLSECNWKMDFFKTIHLAKITDKDHCSKMVLQAKCREGLKKRLQSNNAPVEYIERLKNELQVINDKGLNDYFLIVQDYVSFAKNNGILVGPGRGSAAGSLVCFVLNITEIDPLKNNLFFERFLNPERLSLPDIDIDFMDNRRDEVIEYLFEKYHQTQVSHIIIFQRLKAKMAIRDIGRILNINLRIIDLISKMFLMKYESDIDLAIASNKGLKEYQKQYPLLFTLAKKMINLPRQIGIHAAGVIISDLPLTQTIPVQSSPDGLYLSQYSMEYLEPLGLIKMDILGLTNLTIIHEILNQIKANKKELIDLYQIPINDQKIFNGLSYGNTLGIFQLESPGMTDLVKKVKPQNIEDLSIISALFRPGPQQNIQTYLRNKTHPEQIRYVDDHLKDILESTFGVIIYQEQVMDIVKKVANYSLAQADLFRRAISKKKAEELQKLKVDFINAAVKNNYDAATAHQIFNYIESFANYGFVHSHSLAYSYISYWLAFLKYYYPLEFFSVLLTYGINSTDKLNLLINDAKKNNLKILPPSINDSNFGFSSKTGALIFGLSTIKGVGNETIKKILQLREQQPHKKFENYLSTIITFSKSGIGFGTTKTLISAGTFDKIMGEHDRYYLLINLKEIYEKAKTARPNGEMLLQPVLISRTPTQQELQELQTEQKQLLGVEF